MTLRDLAPGPVRLAYRYVRLQIQARRLMRAAAGAATPAQWLDVLGRFPTFLAIQKASEITALLEMMRRARPERVCEIGTALGGTSFLLARAAAPGATIILVDPAFDAAREAALRRFAGPGQRVHCLRGLSTDVRIRSRLERLLGGRPLDLLFVDGDHSYEGVSADVASYGPLVRAGGLIAFHDIVPVHSEAVAAATGAWAGGVPQLWRELRGRYGAAASEFVDDPAQDGCGIGLLAWPGASHTGSPTSRQ